MDWFRFKTWRRLREWRWWKRVILEIVVAMLSVAIVTIPAYILYSHVHSAIATLLLVYLFVVILLEQKGGPRIAIFAAVAACLAFDFFLLEPLKSFYITHTEEWIDLLIFLLLTISLSIIYAQQRKLVEQAKKMNDLENSRFEARLQEQRAEVSRRDEELRAFYDIVQFSRDQKELKEQLSRIAQTIMNTFAFCGVRGCSFMLLDVESNVPVVVMPACAAIMPELGAEDERSVTYVMQHGEVVELAESLLITHAMGNRYFRRVVASNSLVERRVYYRNYLVPLFSGQKILGAMRLYVEDDGNPALEAIKHALGKDTLPTEIHAEHFFHLFKHAVFSIEQSLIERALMQKETLRQELQKRTEELYSAIISSVSHDFHTPLTLIKGAASGLLRQGLPNDDEVSYRSTLQDIVSESEWLERIVARMLALSRIDHNALVLEKELYPIEAIILNALESGHMRSLKQGRCIQRNIPDDVPAVELDPVLIGQVVANLVENAIRYTPVESLIEIVVRADDQQLYVEVADYGPGIPPAELDSVFERFYRVKGRAIVGTTQQAEQGSGLGLAVCKGFVEAHGGRIWAENREGGGAIFQFTLPIST